MKRQLATSPHAPAFRNTLVAWLSLTLLTLALCGKVLFSADQIFGAPNTDMAQQFIAWRYFGFAELAAGRLTLWNPHIFAGAPYFGGFQAALLYPLNWLLFLTLETRSAINASVALHCLLMGGFTYHWLRHSNISLFAALMAGALAMLGGTYVTHIYAGHLPNLCAMVWFPLMLRAVDGMLPTLADPCSALRQRVLSMLLGATAVAMQVLAGHPQYVLISAIAIGGYVLVRGWSTASTLQTILWSAGMGLLGGALAAVQLLPGIEAGSETVRNRPLQESFAAMFSLPVENLLTLVLPHVLGSVQYSPYFGRWYFWEMCMYVGWGAVLLGLLGACRANMGVREINTMAGQRLALLSMCVLALLIALGNSTPLHHFLYAYIPGFDRIRGVSKFAFVLTPVLAYFAALGYGRLNVSHAQWLAYRAVSLGGIAFVLALILQGEIGQDLITWLTFSNESYFLENAERQLNAEAFRNLRHELTKRIVSAFWWSGVELLVWTGVLILIRRKPIFKPLVAVAVVLQMIIWASGVMASTSFSDQLVASDLPPVLNNYEYRVANQVNKNSGLYNGAMDVSGNDPGVTTRYAELMAMMEGKNPNQASQYIDVPHPHPLHVLLRLQYVKQQTKQGGTEWLYVQDPPMPRFSLIDSYSLKTGRDAVLKHMLDPAFNPRKEVVLEQMPLPPPQKGARGIIRATNCTSDTCHVEVRLDKPALLLMTDAWTPSWRVKSENNLSTMPPQASYEVLPGDYAFRAIPLSEGTHRLVIYHSRTALHIGAAISTIALVVLIGLLVWCAWPMCRQKWSMAHAP